MKLGILGGTFNPLHAGHLHVAGEFARLLELDRVLLIPTRVPPHKRAQQLVPGRQRLKMCRLATEGNPLFAVSGVEIRRRGKSYTVDTLAYLRRKYPRDRLFLLMGEDMFLTLDSWRRASEIIKMAAIAAAPRGGSSVKMKAKKERLEAMGASVWLCPITFLPVSSTEIRRRVRAGESLEGLLSPDVAAYIKKKRLYEG